MQLKNDYDREVFNGDIGRSRIDHDEGELALDFDGRPVAYEFGELDELALAYASTIHKAQGSEFPAVVIPLHDAALHAAAQPALHGLTRGKRLVVIVGQRKAIGIAVRGVRGRRRWSKLRSCSPSAIRPSRAERSSERR